MLGWQTRPHQDLDIAIEYRKRRSERVIFFSSESEALAERPTERGRRRSAATTGTSRQREMDNVADHLRSAVFIWIADQARELGKTGTEMEGVLANYPRHKEAYLALSQQSCHQGPFHRRSGVWNDFRDADGQP